MPQCNPGYWICQRDLRARSPTYQTIEGGKKFHAQHPENLGLLRAMERKTPLVYFCGTVPGRYVPTFPSYALLLGRLPSWRYGIFIAVVGRHAGL